MEKHIKKLKKLVESFVNNNNKRKYDDKENEKRNKKARTYVECQISPSHQ